MTLIVGILCDEGVVLATDRQVSHGAMGMLTVGKAGTKATLFRDQAIFAFSGPISVGQQISDALASQEGKFQQRTCASVVKELIQPEVHKVLKPLFEMATTTIPVVGQGVAQSEVLCVSLLAARFSDGIKMIEINRQGSCEVLTPSAVPFVCHGAGKNNADPILNYLWSIFWKAGVPTLREAILAGYWTVQVVSNFGTPTVGLGIDVFTLCKVGKEGRGAKAEQIPEDRFSEHQEFIAAVEQAMRDVRDKVRSSSTASAPDPPIPAA